MSGKAIFRPGFPFGAILGGLAMTGAVAALGLGLGIRSTGGALVIGAILGIATFSALLKTS